MPKHQASFTKNFFRLLSVPVACASLVVSAHAQTDTERIDQLEKELTDITSGMARQASNSDGLPLHGFLDVSYAYNNYEDVAVKQHGFNVGLLDFYLTPQFSDNAKSVVELVFEVDAHGAVVVDFERAQIGYTLNDKATLWGGRFHTPYGYWNTAFHNGAQIQTSVLRPRFLAFGDKGGVLPAHLVGAWVTGKTGMASGKLTYDAFAGNGPKLVNVAGPASGTMDSNMAGDDNHNLVAGLNIGYEFPGQLEGLKLAAHGLQGSVNAYDGGNAIVNRTDLNMLGGSAVYLANDWEVMSEYYHFSDQNRINNTGPHTSWAGYAQVGKEFNDLTPFVRWEKAGLNQQDHYFGDQETGRAYSRFALGLNYSLNPQSALKFEWLNSKFEADAVRGTGRFNSLLAQYAIRF